MARKKDAGANEEPLDTEESSAEQAETSDAAPEGDELLAEGPTKPQGRTSGVFWAILLVFVVIVLVVAVYVSKQKAREREEADRAAAREALGAQLTTIRDNLSDAANLIDADPPDIEGAIEALNNVGDQINDLALSPAAAKAGLSGQLADLQGQIRRTADAIKARNVEYEETVKSAQRELKADSLREVRPLVTKIEVCVSQVHGDAETPLMVPGMSSVSSEEEPAEQEPTSGKEEQTESP